MSARGTLPTLLPLWAATRLTFLLPTPRDRSEPHTTTASSKTVGLLVPVCSQGPISSLTERSEKHSKPLQLNIQDVSCLSSFTNLGPEVKASTGVQNGKYPAPPLDSAYKADPRAD